MKAIDVLSDFIRRSEKVWQNNEWLRADEMQVYVRKGNRYIEGKRVKTLEIGNVEVSNKGKGVFTGFLCEAHLINPWQITLVESVLEERFCKFFERQGLIQIPNSVPPSYYWWTERGKHGIT